jgi:hypothetical protein
VERGLAQLTEKQIRRGTCRSTIDLEQASRSYLDVNNLFRRPFVWSETADPVLEGI